MVNKMKRIISTIKKLINFTSYVFFYMMCGIIQIFIFIYGIKNLENYYISIPLLLLFIILCFAQLSGIRESISGIIKFVNFFTNFIKNFFA